MGIWDLFITPKDPVTKYKIILAVITLIVLLVIWFNATIWNELKQFVVKSDASAICVIIPTAECPTVAGYVTFKEDGKKGIVSVDFNLHGIPPGEHGVHIHEFGDLRVATSPETPQTECCKYTGAHYNPLYKYHGGLDTGHIGDLGNILADINGNVNEHIESTQLRIRGAHSIVGRALVIHTNKDDLGHGNNSESKINGNSGARIACGVVGYSDI